MRTYILKKDWLVPRLNGHHQVIKAGTEFKEGETYGEGVYESAVGDVIFDELIIENSPEWFQQITTVKVNPDGFDVKVLDQ